MTFRDYLPTGIILFLFVPITLLNAQNRQIISLSDTYDFDGDGLSEFLSIEKTNDTNPIPDKVAFIEIDDFGNHKELWNYRFNPGIKDAKIVDVNNDGNPEISVLSFTISSPGTGKQSPWLYLFEWSNTKFSGSPSITWRASALEYPSNPFNFTSLDFDNDGFSEIAMALGSFSRKILLIEIKDPGNPSSVTIDDEIDSPDLSTGFGKINLFSEDHDGDGDSDLIAINVEFEKTTIHIFENDRGNFSSSQQHSILNDALFSSDRSQALTQIPRLISSGASFIDLNNDGKKELVLPFQNGNTTAFEIGSNDIRPAKLSQQEEHWLNVSDKSLGKDDVNEILLARAELGITSQTSSGLKHDVVKGPDSDTNEMKILNKQFPSDISNQKNITQAPSVSSQKIDASSKTQNETPASVIPKKEIIKIESIKPIKTGSIQSTLTGEMEPSVMMEKDINEISDVNEIIESKPLIEASNQSKPKGQELRSSEQINIQNAQKIDRKKIDQPTKNIDGSGEKLPVQKYTELLPQQNEDGIVEKTTHQSSGARQSHEEIKSSKPDQSSRQESKQTSSEILNSQSPEEISQKLDMRKSDLPTPIGSKLSDDQSDIKKPSSFQKTELPDAQLTTPAGVASAEKPVQWIDKEDSITSSPNQKAVQPLAVYPSKKTIKLTALPGKLAKPSGVQEITEGTDVGSSKQKKFQSVTASEKNKTVDFNKSSESSKLSEMNAGITQPVTASTSPKAPIEDTFLDSGTASRTQEYPSIAGADLSQSQSQQIKNTGVVNDDQTEMETPSIDTIALPLSTEIEETDRLLGKNNTQTKNAEYPQSQDSPTLSSLNASDIKLVLIHEEGGNLAEVDSILSTYSSSISTLNARKGELKAIEKTGTNFAEADYSKYEADPKKMLKLELKSININQVKGNNGFLFSDLPKDAFILDTLYARKTFNFPLEMDNGKSLHSFQPLSIPIGASFNPSTRSITWTPMEKQRGYHRLYYLVEYELKDEVQIKEKKGEGVKIVSKTESKEIDLYLYVRENNESTTSEISP